MKNKILIGCFVAGLLLITIQSKALPKFDVVQLEDIRLIKCETIRGDMSFTIGDIEYLRICENGDFIVKGKEVQHDEEVYKGFKEWIINNKGDVQIR